MAAWLNDEEERKAWTNGLTRYLAYRLYTVIPQLLDLISDLTNWYIRFNRTRLKGANGPEDTCAALNTLYETLLTLCLTMVSGRNQRIA